MSTKEFDKYLKEFKEYGKKVTASEAANKKFLTELGILTPTGKPTKNFLRKVSK
jgi:hypothetical protein